MTDTKQDALMTYSEALENRVLKHSVLDRWNAVNSILQETGYNEASFEEIQKYGGDGTTPIGAAAAIAGHRKAAKAKRLLEDKSGPIALYTIEAITVSDRYARRERMRVDGGWIYSVISMSENFTHAISQVFVPDPSPSVRVQNYFAGEKGNQLRRREDGSFW